MVSVALYARRRGVHPRTVRRWIHEGRELADVLRVERTPGGHIRLLLALGRAVSDTTSEKKSDKR